MGFQLTVPGYSARGSIRASKVARDVVFFFAEAGEWSLVLNNIQVLTKI